MNVMSRFSVIKKQKNFKILEYFWGDVEEESNGPAQVFFCFVSLNGSI